MSRRIRWISFVIACVLALPLPLGVWAGVHLRLSPLLFLQSLLIHTPLVPIAALGALTLGLSLAKDRWFCRHLCPTGALCDRLSESRSQRSGWRRMPHLHRWLALLGLGTAAVGFPIIGVLDPIAVFQGAWAPLHGGLTLAACGGTALLSLVLLLSWSVPYAWCRRLCPLGGLQTVLTDVRRAIRRGWRTRASAAPEAASADGWRRRNLLIVGLGAAGGWLLGARARQHTGTLIRPPGSRPEDAFLASCVRCGNCTRACPTHIISPAIDLGDPAGLLAPRVDVDHGHCPPTCNACSTVCPTGAIQPFTTGGKSSLIMGLAVINTEPCLMANGAECDLCIAVCPYKAIDIKDTEHASMPRVIADNCTGCGACVERCPPKVISLVAVVRG